MWIVDFCKDKMDFGRIEIQEGLRYSDPEGYFDGEDIAAMTAIDLQNEGYETITFKK